MIISGAFERLFSQVYQVFFFDSEPCLLLQLFGSSTNKRARGIQHSSRQLFQRVLAARHTRLHSKNRVLFLVLLARDHNEHANGRATHENDRWDNATLLIGDVALEFDKAHTGAKHVNRLHYQLLYDELVVERVAPVIESLLAAHKINDVSKKKDWSPPACTGVSEVSGTENIAACRHKLHMAPTYAHIWSISGQTNLHLLELVKKLLVRLVLKLERHLVFSPDRYLKLLLGPGRCHLAK